MSQHGPDSTAAGSAATETTASEVTAPRDTADVRASRKRAAAEWAADQVESGMVVGLGTGSTAVFAVRRLAQRLADGEIDGIVGIPTSEGQRATALAAGLTLTDLQQRPVIDLTIDGADEVDPDYNLIKGGGGALLREKIVAQASRREIIVIDSSKRSVRLGTVHPLPVEVIDFGWRPEVLHLERLGARVALRADRDGAPYRTDGGNLILDCTMGPIDRPAELAAALLERAGIVEVGLFCGLTSDLVIGTAEGVRHEVVTARR